MNHMEKRTIANSELVLTPEGKVYHLKLEPGDVADTVFLVGDPGRVRLMSDMFDQVDVRVENREFVTHTGLFQGKRISVVSTGIGTDNIDIVVNEIDALVNIDLDSRQVKDLHRSLNFIRIGTSGALHADIDPGNVIVSATAGGLDNLMHFYGGSYTLADQDMGKAFAKHMDWNMMNSRPYFIHASPALFDRVMESGWFSGITLSAPGFYAPQGRSLRTRLADPDFIEKVSRFRHESVRINNFEMEGSALYGLSGLLGHHSLTICIALANRITGKFITDYQPFMKDLLGKILDKMTRDGQD